LTRLRTAILISGRGSNMQALIDSCHAADAPAEITLVISNEPAAAGLVWAGAKGIPTKVIHHRDFPDRPAFDVAIDATLRGAGIQLICLAGFMRILSDKFVEDWRDRMINIHPSLLPEFKGLDTHARALAAGVRRHGCTVHFVRPEMDTGPIIVQASVRVQPADTPETLAARVLKAEHRIYPLALRWVAEGRVLVRGEQVLLDGAVRESPLVDLRG
jgi:phosphoribosylglycinamide formyltransferase 1